MDSTAGSEATTSAIPPLKLRAVTPGFRASSSGRDITQTLELYADRPAAIDWPRTTNAWRVLIKQFDDELRLAMKVEPDEFVAAFSDVNAMGDECIAIIMAVAEAVFGIKRSSQAASTTVQERGAKARRVRSSELLIMYREQVRKHKRALRDFTLRMCFGKRGRNGVRKRLHDNLRKAKSLRDQELRRLTKADEQRRAVKAFNLNRWAYLQSVLGKGTAGHTEPKFSVQVAEAFVRKTATCVVDRASDVYWVDSVATGLDMNMDRAPPPTVPYGDRLDRYEMLALLMTRNGDSMTGVDGVPYIILQKSEVARQLLFEQTDRCLRERQCPNVNGLSRMRFIDKGKGGEKPEHMRSLRVGGTQARYLEGVLNRPLVRFLDANGYNLDNKAFKPGRNGTLENGKTLRELIANARRMQHELCIVFHDVEAAFPSILHGFVHLAMWYYHVPVDVAQLVWYMFEGLYARVEIGDELSNYIWNGKELPQGHGDSPTIFGMIDGMMMGLYQARCLQCFQVPHGYPFAAAGRTYDAFQFADDLATLSVALTVTLHDGQVLELSAAAVGQVRPRA